MRRGLTVGAILAAATLLTPAIAAAQQPLVSDYASGAGLWQAANPDDPGPGSIGFQAIFPGTAGIEFDYRRQGNGRGFHAEVVCISVQGNEAWMVLAVQESNLPVDPGPVLVAYLADDGDGQNDLFDLDPPVTNVFDDRCGTRTVVFEPDPVRGNVNLAEGSGLGEPG